MRAVAALVAVALTNVTLLWHFHDRYWYPVDEGFYATVAERVLTGDVLHLDVQHFHPGYGDFLNAAAFRLFGVDLVSLRYPLIAGAFLQSAFVFGILHRRSLLIASVASVSSIALGVVQFLNPTPHWYALYGSCALLYWLVRAPREGWIRIAGAGCLVGLIAMFHQLIGVLAGTGVLVVALQERSRDARGVGRLFAQVLLVIPLAGLLAYIVRAPTLEFSGVLLFASWPLAILLKGLRHTRTSNRDAVLVLLQLAAGATVSAIPLVLYSAIHGSWQQTLQETVFAALALGLRGDSVSPWYAVVSLAGLHQAVTPSTPSDVINGLFWTVLPLLAAINGLFTLLSAEGRRASWSPLPTVSAFQAISSLFMQGAVYLFFNAGLSLAAVLWWLAGRGRAATVAGAAGAAALATVALTFHAAQPSTRSNLEILRGVTVLSGQWSPPMDRASLRLDLVEQARYRAIVDVIKENTPADAQIFAVPNDPQLYFLTGRRNPFRFNHTGMGIQTKADLAGVLHQLRTDPPAIVTFRRDRQYNTWSSDAILEHVRRDYDRIAEISGVEVYRLRRRPASGG